MACLPFEKNFCTGSTWYRTISPRPRALGRGACAQRDDEVRLVVRLVERTQRVLSGAARVMF